MVAIKVHVRLALTGRPLPDQIVDAVSPVATFKRQLADAYDGLPDPEADDARDAEVRVRVLFGKKVLEDRKTLAESGVTEGSTVDVVYRLARALVFTGSADGTARIWSADTGECIKVLSGHTAAVVDLDVHPGGTRVCTASADRTARLWSVPDGDCLRECTGHHGGLQCIRFSPTGVCFGSTSTDRTLRVWRESAGEEAYVLHLKRDTVCTASDSPDGKNFVTCSKEKVAKIRLVADGLTVLHTLEGHQQVVNYACYSPNNRLIGTASGDWTAKIWDAKTYAEIGTLKGHQGTVNWMDFASNDRTAATCSNDCTVMVWDVEACTCLATLSGHAHHVYTCHFSPDGNRIVTASRDKTAKVWNARSGECELTLAGHAGMVNQAMWSP
mmetsp:Transcript_104592/g.326191  ORF Transcript_104592/g.326191 Transcript_104592/m.326191 type:complete len:385 (-) Transcript_104592:8-1162(-)